MQYIAFDTETTGLYPESERIVEYAAILFDHDGNELEQFQSFVNPDRPIPHEATFVHGITDEMVADAPRFSELIDKLPPWLADDLIKTGDGYYQIPMVAHNAKFDVGFLKEEYKFAMKPIYPHMVLCTYEIAKHCYPRRIGRHNLKLGTLASEFGIDANGAHRALADARMCKGIFLELRKRFPNIIRV